MLKKPKGIKKLGVKGEDEKCLFLHDSSQIPEREKVSVVKKSAIRDLYKVLNVKKVE